MGEYVPGSVFKIVTSVAALGSGAITAGHHLPAAAGGREDRPARVGLPDPRRPPRLHRLAGPRLRPGDRGLVQHLLRPDRPAHGRRGPGRLGRPARLRGADPVRPADGGQPGDERRRHLRRRLQGRRRAGQRGLRPGRDPGHPAPDGARRGDRRQRRRDDEAPAGDLDRRPGRAAGDQPAGPAAR